MTRTIKELIIELAQVEDAIRHASLRMPAAGAATSLPSGSAAPVDPELIELENREEAIVRELRGHGRQGVGA